MVHKQYATIDICNSQPLAWDGHIASVLSLGNQNLLTQKLWGENTTIWYKIPELLKFINTVMDFQYLSISEKLMAQPLGIATYCF